MNEQTASQGLIELMVQRFETHQLGRLLQLRRSVDSGETLSDYERDFLEEVCHEAMDSLHLVSQFPDYQPLFTQAVRLYHEITSRAFENERRQVGAA